MLPRRSVLGLLGAAALAAPLLAVSARSDRVEDGHSSPSPSPSSDPTSPSVTADEGDLAVLDPAQCVLRQEFDGPAGAGVDTSIWVVEQGAGGWGNGEQQAYTSARENLQLDGQGNLALTMVSRQVVDAAGNPARFTSARIMTRQAYAAKRIEARLKIPTGIGVWPAFWTLGSDWPTVGWPRSGELDIAEVVNATNAVNVVAHAALTDPSAGVVQWRQFHTDVFTGTSLLDEWHVFAVDLAPGQVTFSVDGRVSLVVAKEETTAGQDWPFDQPQFVLLDLAMHKSLPADQSPALPVSFLVDYLRVWPADAH